LTVLLIPVAGAVAVVLAVLVVLVLAGQAEMVLVVLLMGYLQVPTPAEVVVDQLVVVVDQTLAAMVVQV
jgi:hypothetical protein